MQYKPEIEEFVHALYAELHFLWWIFTYALHLDLGYLDYLDSFEFPDTFHYGVIW